ncbi:hypothetical protein [Neolewinella antarctica]|uniref:Uncharacterized protein n=1 Tax=Neolewinella antarctica TaxID=442734 RepID=A0ABX0XGF7_9BACT|nr:hypothetical protein [Neolewinella antarctica]NJC28405.1 hypothetical protein [Neolewinella antarctica]
MSKSQNIHTFDELEKRKRELELEVEVSQRELAHSLGTSKVNLNDFLLKKVALPIGGAIVGVFMISKIFGGKKRHTHEYHEKTIVKEVPSTTEQDPAKYHYPVPPPETDKEKDAPRYVAQQTKYQRPTADQASPADPKAKHGANFSQKDKKGLLSLATVASVAKIAVPAVKMIIKAVKDHKDKQLAANTDGVPNV